MITNSSFLRDIKPFVLDTFSSLLRMFPEAVKEAQLGLVHHGVLGRWNFVSWAAGALKIFKLCCRVVKGVNVGQVVFALGALDVLWLKALFDEEVLLFFF